MAGITRPDEKTTDWAAWLNERLWWIGVVALVALAGVETVVATTLIEPLAELLGALIKTYNLDLLVFLAVVNLGGVGWIGYLAMTSSAKASRYSFLERYTFPAALRDKLKERHPTLSDADVDQVLEGLRQFFGLCQHADAVQMGRSFGMPSKIVDDAWHELILMTREYTRLCDGAFGGYLHHTPAALSDEPQKRGLLRTLQHLSATPQERWKTLNGMPLLFAMDLALQVEGGFHYDAESFAALDKLRLETLAAGGNKAIEHGGLLACGGDDGGGGDGGDGGGGDGGGGCSGGGCSGGGCGGGCGG